MPRKEGPRKNSLAAARVHLTMVWEKIVLVQLINHYKNLAAGQVTEAALYSQACFKGNQCYELQNRNISKVIFFTVRNLKK